MLGKHLMGTMSVYSGASEKVVSDSLVPHILTAPFQGSEEGATYVAAKMGDLRQPMTAVTKMVP